MDDGSTDNSAELVRKYAERDSRIVVRRQHNGGVSRARNAAFAASSSDSDYLLFLDADDVLEPSMLHVLVAHLDEHHDASVGYCEYLCIDENDHPLPPTDPRVVGLVSMRYIPARFGVRVLGPEVPETPFVSIYCGWAGLIPSNSLIRRSAFAATPGWDESFGQPAEDTDLFLHLALQGQIHHVAQRMVRYRRHARQSTSDRARALAQDRKLYRKWSQHSELEAHQQALVKQARWFREARLLPYLWLTFGTSEFMRGDILDGAKCYARAAKQLPNLFLWLFDGTAKAGVRLTVPVRRDLSCSDRMRYSGRLESIGRDIEG